MSRSNWESIVPGDNQLRCSIPLGQHSNSRIHEAHRSGNICGRWNKRRPVAVVAVWTLAARATWTNNDSEGRTADSEAPGWSSAQHPPRNGGRGDGEVIDWLAETLLTDS